MMLADNRAGMIEKQEHRERLLKAIQDYNQLRKGFIGQGQQDKSTEADPELFDGTTQPGPVGHGRNGALDYGQQS